MSKEIKIGDATLEYEIQTDEDANKRFAVITGARVSRCDEDYYLYHYDNFSLAIPAEIEGCPVTSITDSAFYECSGLTHVTIPDSVTSIGVGIFSSCLKLTSIQVADGNPSYKSEANLLLTKDGLTLIAVPGGLTNVTIPDSVTSIGSKTFYGCEIL